MNLSVAKWEIKCVGKFGERTLRSSRRLVRWAAMRWHHCNQV